MLGAPSVVRRTDPERGRAGPAAQQGRRGERAPDQAVRSQSQLRDKAERRDLGARQSRGRATNPRGLTQERWQPGYELRIDRNLKAARALRYEALALLKALIAELPPTALERPSTLMRLGELEWEDARERFLVDFARWEKLPSDQRGAPPEPDYKSARARFAVRARRAPDLRALRSRIVRRRLPGDGRG